MKRISSRLFVFPPVMVMSVYLTAIGFLVPVIQQEFMLSSAQVGLISTMQSIGTAGSLIVCFCLVSAMNKSRVFLITAAVYTACIVILAYASAVSVIYIMFVLIGLFVGTATTLSNSLVLDGGSKSAGYYIGILHGIWAGLAAFGPFFVLLFNDDYKKTLLWLGILTAASLVLFAFGQKNNITMPFWEDKSKLGTIGKLLRTFKYKGILVLLIVGFFTTIIRSGFTFFIRSYIEYLGRDSIFGAYILGVFFIGMAAGRIIYGKISHRVSSSAVLLITNSAALLAFLAMVMINDMIAFIILMTIGALCISANVPIMLTKAYEIMPNDSTGATSFVFLSLVTGSLIGPPVIGWLSDAANMRIAMLCCISVLIPVIAFSIKMLRAEKFKKQALEEN